MTPGRRLGATVVVLLLAALGLWSAGRLVWLRAVYTSPLRGPVTVTATGAQLKPELSALALLALAGVAGLVAVRGWGRRVVGILLAAAGVWAAGLASVWLLGGAAPAGALAGPVASVPAGPPARTAAPLPALIAGLLLVLAGLVMVRWAAAMPGLGARYAAPASARRARDREADWWHALDAGEDPTTAGRGTDPEPPP